MFRAKSRLGRSLLAAAAATALALGSVASATVVPASAEQASTGLRVFSPDSFWYTKLPDSAQLAENSAQIAATMHTDSQNKYSAAGTRLPQITVNTHSYSPTRYIVDDSIPTQRVYFNNQQRKPANDVFVYEMFNALDAPMRSVRIPADAVPGAGSDGEIIIYDRGDVNDPSDDKLVELWQLSRRADGAWQAVWGAAIENPGAQQGQFMWPTGVTASGLPMEGGIIQYEELKAGRIDHVLGIAIPWATPGTWQFPANRTDGRAHPQGKPTPRYGQMLRIDPNLDIDSLNLHPSAEAIVRAGQEYGYVVWDKSPIVAFRAENPIGNPNIDYSNVFPGGRDYRVLEDFPWEHLQVLDADYSVLADVRSARNPVLPDGQKNTTLQGVYTQSIGSWVIQSRQRPNKYHYSRCFDETYTLYDESMRKRFNHIWGDDMVTPFESQEIDRWLSSGALSRKRTNARYYAAVDVLAEMARIEQLEAGQPEATQPEATPSATMKPSAVVPDGAVIAGGVAPEVPKTVELTANTKGDAAPVGVRTVVVPEMWAHFNAGPLQLSLTRPDPRYYHTRERAVFEILDESIRAEFNRIWADRKLDWTEIPKISQWRKEGKLTKTSSEARTYPGTA